MKILAIETSCDETAVAVINVRGEHDIGIVSNVVSSQVKLHAKWGGVVPALAAREHAKNIEHVFETALKEAGITDIAKQIDLFAVTRGPGLGPSLLVGLTFARTLAWKWDKPLVGVDHLDGHIHANWLEPEKPLADIFPALNLVVSGGHTELILMRSHDDFKIVGETQDDAVGEAFDKVARLLGLGYPGGPAIAKLAQRGDPEKYPLPRPMLKGDNLDFSYSGLKTAVLYLIRDLNVKRMGAKMKADIAASFQNAAVDVLVRKTVRAAEHFGVKAILLSGGVSANASLRERLHAAAEELGTPFYKPQMKYTTDNAAMIAVAAYFIHKNETTAPSWKTVSMDANLRLGMH